MRRAWWILLVGTLLAACGSKSTSSTSNSVTEPGTDAGTNEKPPAPPITNGAFTHYGMASGFPSFAKDAKGNIVSGIMDVSGDAAGNIWIAGGDGLYLIRKGSIQLEKFTAADGLQRYAILSVAGLGENEAMVGYQGEFGGLEDNDPPEMVMSGGADRVVLDGDALSVTHYVLGTPPGPGYPTGRYKIRSVYTIRATFDGPYAGDVWFGGNHGVAMWNQKAGTILEHQAAAIQTPSYMSGDHFGLAFDNVGDVWIGGAHRIAKIPYATDGGDFFAELNPVVDVWPDADPVNRTDDHVKALAVDTAGDVWIGSLINGLARYSAAGVCRNFTVADGLPGPAVNALAADPDGTIWVGTYDGVGRYDPANDTWSYIRHLSAGLPTDEIMSLQIDRRTSPRTVYIGTLKGISTYNGE